MGLIFIIAMITLQKARGALMLKNFRLFAAKWKKCKLLLCFFKGCWEFDIFVIVSNFVFRFRI